MKIVPRIIQIIIIIPATICFVWAVACPSISEGTFIGGLLFGALILGAVFYKKLFQLIKRLWKSVGGKVVLILLAAVIAFGLFAATFFTVQMLSHMYKPVDDVQAVVVLGCRVKGETPSSMLWIRTKTAYDILVENPDAVAVVSGGQGPGEDISEAEAMRRMLTEWGIEDYRIIMEDRSTSTAENFDNSAAILRELGISEKVAIVTSEFHQYRASLYARRSGIEPEGFYSGGTARTHLLNYWIREWAALAALYVFGY